MTEVNMRITQAESWRIALQYSVASTIALFNNGGFYIPSVLSVVKVEEAFQSFSVFAILHNGSTER